MKKTKSKTLLFAVEKLRDLSAEQLSSVAGAQPCTAHNTTCGATLICGRSISM